MTDETPKPTLREAGAKAKQGLEQAARKGRDVIAATRDQAEAVFEDTRDKTMRAAVETNRLFQEHPITAVAAAAAAGAVLGIFLPRLPFMSRAGKLAGKAVKAAVDSGAAQTLATSAIAAAVKAEEPEASPAPEPPHTT